MPEFITQIMPGLLLVGLGMLIGYVLWFRDRQRDEIIQKRLHETNRQLKGELESSRRQTSEDLSELKIRENKIQMLQDLCDSLVNHREESNEQRIQLESELSGKTELLQVAQQELDEYKEKFETLSQSVQLSEESWHSKIGKSESMMSSKEADLRHLNNENRRLASELQTRESRIAELSKELETQRSMLATASKNTNSLEKDNVSLESSLNSQSEMLKEARARVESAESARTRYEQELQELRGQIEDQQAVKSQLNEALLEREKSERDGVVLNEKLRIAREQLQQLFQKSEKLEVDVENYRSSAEALTTRLGNQESTIRHQQTRLADLGQQLEKFHQRQEVESQKLGETTSGLEKQLQQYRVKVESTQLICEELKCQVAYAEKEKNKLLESARKIEQEKIRLASNCELLTQQVQELTQERQELVDRLERQAATHSTQLTDFQNRIADLQKQSGQTQQQIQELRQDRENLRHQLQDLENNQDESEQLIEMKQAELMTRLKLTLTQRDEAFRNVAQIQEKLNQANELVELRTRDAATNRKKSKAYANCC